MGPYFLLYSKTPAGVSLFCLYHSPYLIKGFFASWLWTLKSQKTLIKAIIAIRLIQAIKTWIPKETLHYNKQEAFGRGAQQKGFLWKSWGEVHCSKKHSPLYFYSRQFWAIGNFATIREPPSTYKTRHLSNSLKQHSSLMSFLYGGLLLSGSTHRKQFTSQTVSTLTLPSFDPQFEREICK